MSSILIVDDHPDIRKLLSVILGNTYQLLEASDGASALELIKQRRPRIILLDCMMPGTISGLQVLQAVKGNPVTRSTLVAMISARGQASDSEEARAQGADAYFVKPFSPLQVVSWVRQHLD